MFFKGNEKYKGEHLDYGVFRRDAHNNPEYLISVTRPKDICGRACSLSASEIVRLDEGDLVSIRTQHAGQSFGMFQDKAIFSLCKLN